MKRVVYKYMTLFPPRTVVAYNLHLYMFNFLGYMYVYIYTSCVVLPRLFFKRLSEDCVQIRAMGRWQTYS
ncbi:hypothetical protein JHK84_057057 [Glycine max]|nr:hypothetical protein JHK84_057057 [Glycine max]